MYATFWSHCKAAFASMVPFVIVYFTAQPFDEAMGFLVSGGVTIAPALVGIYICGWALMSMGLLRALRFDQSVVKHYVVYAVTGAIALTVVALGILTAVRVAREGTWDIWNVSTFTTLLVASPLLGALGAVIGRRVLAFFIQWHRWLEREVLPNALEFVEGKHDRAEFHRMKADEDGTATQS